MLDRLRSLVVLVGGAAVGCGTVDPGEDFQFAQVTYDQGYFFCKVEPMLFAQRCGPGLAGTDPAGGCHFSIPRFQLSKHDPIACKGVTPTGPVPPEALSNFQAAARAMYGAKLLNRPTKRAAHPRKIFDEDSPEADILREWATRSSSQ